MIFENFDKLSDYEKAFMIACETNFSGTTKLPATYYENTKLYTDSGSSVLNEIQNIKNDVRYVSQLYMHTDPLKEFLTRMRSNKKKYKLIDSFLSNLVYYTKCESLNDLKNILKSVNDVIRSLNAECSDSTQNDIDVRNFVLIVINQLLPVKFKALSISQKLNGDSEFDLTIASTIETLMNALTKTSNPEVLGFIAYQLIMLLGMSHVITNIVYALHRTDVKDFIPINGGNYIDCIEKIATNPNIFNLDEERFQNDDPNKIGGNYNKIYNKDFLNINHYGTLFSGDNIFSNKIDFSENMKDLLRLLSKYEEDSMIGNGFVFGPYHPIYNIPYYMIAYLRHINIKMGKITYNSGKIRYIINDEDIIYLIFQNYKDVRYVYGIELSDDNYNKKFIKIPIPQDGVIEFTFRELIENGITDISEQMDEQE